MNADNVTAIVVALIGSATTVLTTLVLLRLRRIEPTIKAIDRAVNSVPDTEPTIRAMTKSAGEATARIEAEQGRIERRDRSH